RSSTPRTRRERFPSNPWISQERTMNVLLKSCLFAALAAPLVLATTTSAHDQDGHAGNDRHQGPPPKASPLVNKVRAATRRYKDISAALAEGWVQGTPCVSGPNAGAMGVHFVKPERIGDGKL